MKLFTLATAVAVAVLFAASPSLGAQGKGQGGPKKTHAAKASKDAKDHQKVKVKDTQPGKAKVKANKPGKKQVGPAGHLGLSPVQQRLHDHPRLADRLRGRFRDGDLVAAADGFRNLGQFVAAVNVSNNHGIPFHNLRARMVGEGMSLGQAIRAERRDLDGIRIARDAEIDADRLIAETAGSSGRPRKR